MVIQVHHNHSIHLEQEENQKKITENEYYLY